MTGERTAESGSPPRAPRLGRAAVTGIAWIGASRWVVRIANFVAFIFLARLLPPHEFAIVAVARLVSNFFRLGSFGLQSATVQQLDEGPQDLDVAWTYDRLVTCVVLAALLFAAGQPLAVFLRAPESVDVIRAFAAILLLQIPENLAMVVVQRELDYRRQFYLEAVIGVGMFAAVPLAFVIPNVWSFVIAYALGRVLRIIVSYIVLPKVHRVSFHGPTFRRLFGFGRWMIAVRLVDMARNQVEQIVLAAVLGPMSLAYYQIGSRLSAQIAADLFETTRRVLFPIYAKVQTDVERMARTYVIVVGATWLVIIPAAVALVLLARPAIHVLFGDDWLEASTIAQILAVAAAFKITTGTSHALFRGRGLPNRELLLSMLYVAILIPTALWLAPTYGLEGIGYAVLVAEILPIPVWLVMLWMVFRLSPLRLFGQLVLPVIVSAALALAVLLVQRAVGDGRPLVELVAGVGAGGAATALVLFIAWRSQKFESVNVLVENLRRLLARRKAAK